VLVLHERPVQLQHRRCLPGGAARAPTFPPACRARLSLGARRAQGHPFHVMLGAAADLFALNIQREESARALEPALEALASAVQTDPMGDALHALFDKLPAVPDPLLLGARQIEGGRYGEGPHGQPGGVDVSATVARFGPCVFEGGAEGAGAYATGVRVAPTGLALGATGAKVAPTLIDVSPGLIDISATGADVSPAEISVAPALMRIAPGFVSARPGTVQDMLAGVGKGIARAVGLSGAAAPPPS